jgi:hypothetical protein
VDFNGARPLGTTLHMFEALAHPHQPLNYLRLLYSNTTEIAPSSPLFFHVNSSLAPTTTVPSIGRYLVFIDERYSFERTTRGQDDACDVRRNTRSTVPGTRHRAAINSNYLLTYNLIEYYPIHALQSHFNNSFIQLNLSPICTASPSGRLRCRSYRVSELKR